MCPQAGGHINGCLCTKTSTFTDIVGRNTDTGAYIHVGIATFTYTDIETYTGIDTGTNMDKGDNCLFIIDMLTLHQ